MVVNVLENVWAEEREGGGGYCYHHRIAIITVLLSSSDLWGQAAGVARGRRGLTFKSGTASSSASGAGGGAGEGSDAIPRSKYDVWYVLLRTARASNDFSSVE